MYIGASFKAHYAYIYVLCLCLETCHNCEGRNSGEAYNSVFFFWSQGKNLESQYSITLLNFKQRFVTIYRNKLTV